MEEDSPRKHYEWIYTGVISDASDENRRESPKALPAICSSVHMDLRLRILFILLLSWRPMMEATAEEYRQRKDEPLADIAEACPGVHIELRYATAKNITGSPLYPLYARALLRRSVAERLRRAQEFLTPHGYGLKIWDAYRPPSVQERLWSANPNRDYVGNPASGGSLHSWGVAVDVTLVDRTGRELQMPTDFDVFGPAAARRYSGGDPVVAANLRMLQQAMISAGFLAMRDEWWHFVARDFRDFGPVTPPVSLIPVLP